MNFAIILSGGIGNRLKGINIPKQYYEVKGKMIIQYTMELIVKSNVIDSYIIVASEEWHENIKAILAGEEHKFLGFALPGENRQLSIYNGLKKMKEIADVNDVVLIHDAVRPCVSIDLIRKCITSCKNSDGVIPVLPMKDTIYVSQDGIMIDTSLSRESIYAGQSPEAFSFGKYLYANENLSRNDMLKINGSTEPAILAGMNIAMIDGEESNYKITTYEDLKRYIRKMEE